ncbi:MAG: TolC family protein, partial [Elusimicrobia bacterium]|nr:TolC family protein [Elusimicrobiota bacterium]
LYLAAANEERMAKAMLSRARREFLPDFSVMYDKQSASGGMSGYEAGVGVKFPLWLGRPRGMKAEAEANLAGTEAAARAMRNEVLKMTSQEFTETNTRLSLAQKYKSGIIPLADGAFALHRRRYESGQGDFVRLIESFRDLISAETDYYDQLSLYAEHWGRLEQWVGINLLEAKQ